jgi:hypothetical protein
MGRLYEPVMIGLRGSKWGFAGAVSVILIWALTGPLSLFGHVAAHHQYGNNYRHFPDGVPDPEHAESRRTSDQSQIERTNMSDRQSTR